MTGLYDTVIFNKEHLYSKIFTRARKTYITTHRIKGVFYPLMKPTPTPLFWGGLPGAKRGGIPHVVRGAITPPFKPLRVSPYI